MSILQPSHTLQISFLGPFFYDFRVHFNPTDKVSVYAPNCPGHKAGIFTAKNEYPLGTRPKFGHKLEYVVDGDVFEDEEAQYPRRINYCDPGKLILNVTGKATPNCTNAGFRLLVPVPQYVYPLNPSPEVEVVESETPQGARQRYATGLRFYYHADLEEKITMSVQENVVWYSDFDCVCESGLRNSDVDVRMSDPSSGGDPDHDDAIDCFNSIAQLAGVQWWLNFNNPQNPPVPSGFVRGGSDCLAPVVTIGD